MSWNWTAEQILALAPDPSSAKSGRDLANPRKWVTLGGTDDALWGECQGSGKNPYQVQVDLTEPAFRCTCPSRKFPCKHGLGIFLLRNTNAGLFAATEPPGWVSEWLDSRRKRVEQKKQTAQDPAPKKPADPKAQERRAAQRNRRVQEGLDELERWMHDLMRRGLADAQGQPYQFWEGMAARLVDNQVPGAARMVKDMAGIPASGEGWVERLLAHLGRLHLLLEGARRLETLPAPLQAEVRTALGFIVREEDLAADPGVDDTWVVLGRAVEQEAGLKAQRTWILGRRTGRMALLLQFAHGASPLDGSLIPGVEVDGGLVYYPAALPMRALLRERHGAPRLLVPNIGRPVEPIVGSDTDDAAPAEWYALRNASVLPPARGCTTSEAVLDAWSVSLAANPWTECIPVLLRGVVPVRNSAGPHLADGEGTLLPLDPRHRGGWSLLAFAGGHPISAFGEWNGERFHVMSAWEEGENGASRVGGGD